MMMEKCENRLQIVRCAYEMDGAEMSGADLGWVRSWSMLRMYTSHDTLHTYVRMKSERTAGGVLKQSFIFARREVDASGRFLTAPALRIYSVPALNLFIRRDTESSTSPPFPTLANIHPPFGDSRSRAFSLDLPRQPCAG